MAQPKVKKYLPAIDILRILAILAVILIHTTSKSLQEIHFNILLVPLSLYLDQIARFAVPLFFMISGYVLEYTYSDKFNFITYFKKRINRILVPYLFWSVFYYYFVYITHKKTLLYVIIYGDASYQLYFIPSLLIFYFIFPVVHTYAKYILNRWTLPIIALSQIFFLSYDYYIRSYSYSKPVKTILLNYGIFLIGIYFAKHHEKILASLAKWKILLFISALVMAFYVYFEGMSNYLRTHNYLAFWSQWRPSVFLYSFLLFSSLLVLMQKISVPDKYIQYFSSLSFLVFFIHVFILEILSRTILHPMVLSTNGSVIQELWYDPVIFIFIASSSFVFAALVHKIPYASKITG